MLFGREVCHRVYEGRLELRAISHKLLEHLSSKSRITNYFIQHRILSPSRLSHNFSPLYPVSQSHPPSHIPSPDLSCTYLPINLILFNYLIWNKNIRHVHTTPQSFLRMHVRRLLGAQKRNVGEVSALVGGLTWVWGDTIENLFLENVGLREERIVWQCEVGLGWVGRNSIRMRSWSWCWFLVVGLGFGFAFCWHWCCGLVRKELSYATLKAVEKWDVGGV